MDSVGHRYFAIDTSGPSEDNLNMVIVACSSEDPLSVVEQQLNNKRKKVEEYTPKYDFRYSVFDPSVREDGYCNNILFQAACLLDSLGFDDNDEIYICEFWIPELMRRSLMENMKRLGYTISEDQIDVTYRGSRRYPLFNDADAIANQIFRGREFEDRRMDTSLPRLYQPVK